jgi:hypothetical protein
MINLTLPIYWTQQYKTKKNKTVLVGMNWYRNAHYHDQNKMKTYFHDLVSTQLGTYTIPRQFKVHYKIYYKNPACDGANISALIEKFTLDGLQKCNAIVNDNVKYHLSSTWEVVTQDKDNPRCEVSITKI